MSDNAPKVASVADLFAVAYRIEADAAERYDLPGEVRVLNRAGPLPIRTSEIHRAIMERR